MTSLCKTSFRSFRLSVFPSILYLGKVIILMMSIEMNNPNIAQNAVNIHTQLESKEYMNKPIHKDNMDAQAINFKITSFLLSIVKY
tara:strand:- start:131 stop:388 length:258 start_codon:yes stop_codon:yes gene_type:complete